MIQSLINDETSWLEEWFEETRPLSPNEIDNKRVSWLRIHGVPPCACNLLFFSFIASTIGTYINTDDNTHNKLSTNVARVMIKTKGLNVENEIFYVNINGHTYAIHMTK